MRHDAAFVSASPLGFPWETRDPFLACMHHDDRYPAGDDRFAPPRSALVGREMGSDFSRRDGFSMYHGEVVPGFPAHPHRGFETVTVVRRGLLDHADSLGAGARYGNGDVQWLTAGRGIQHAEMFPLLDRDAPNPLELFQIWLNLPRSRKMVEPHFSMLWSETIPRVTLLDEAGRASVVTVIAGTLDGRSGPGAPPSSYGAMAESDLAIWTVRMAPGARLTLPASAAGSNRDAYYFLGGDLRIDGVRIASGNRIQLVGEVPATFENGELESEMLVLQGRPLREPVARYGPFVMNTREEIQRAYVDYQMTRFGGWPWDRDDPVHGREGRFARRPDGTTERPA